MKFASWQQPRQFFVDLFICIVNENWFCGVMVSTLDSESKNPSSSLGRTYDIYVDPGHKEQFWKPAIFLILPTISLLPIGYNKNKVFMYYVHLSFLIGYTICFFGSGGIRTHAIKMTGALNQPPEPLDKR